LGLNHDRIDPAASCSPLIAIDFRAAPTFRDVPRTDCDLHPHRVKLNDIDPQAWLADVLRRISDHPASRLDALRPWNRRKSSATLAA
jgi:hypothetical protein